MTKTNFPTYQYYDEITNEDNVPKDTMTVFGGKTEKVFVRMDSEYLSDLFISKSRGRASYVTYLDRLLNNYSFTRDGAPISKVSVLLKSYASSNGEGYACGEEIGSKIANILGIPTVYNRHIEGIDPRNADGYDEYKHHVISVDYCEYDPDISYDTMLNGYCEYKTCRYQSRREFSLRDWYEFFLYSKYIHDNASGGEIPMPARKKLAQEFVPMYLFRKYGIFDSDFDIHNFVVKHNKSTMDYSLGPNFDMERAFYIKINKDILRRAFQADIEFAYMVAPKETDKYIKSFVKNQKAMMSVASVVPSVFYRDKYTKTMSDYYPVLLDVIKHLDVNALKSRKPKKDLDIEFL